MSTAVDAAKVEWLRSEAKFRSSVDAAIKADWGDRAVESEVITSIAVKADAVAEASAQAAFLKGPLVIDRHLVPGLRRDVLCKLLTLRIGRLGYDAGIRCFVVRVEEQQDVERTLLTVLRRL
jgi:hypothetical protein